MTRPNEYLRMATANPRIWQLYRRGEKPAAMTPQLLELLRKSFPAARRLYYARQRHTFADSQRAKAFAELLQWFPIAKVAGYTYRYGKTTFRVIVTPIESPHQITDIPAFLSAIGDHAAAIEQATLQLPGPVLVAIRTLLPDALRQQFDDAITAIKLDESLLTALLNEGQVTLPAGILAKGNPQQPSIVVRLE